MKLQDLAKFSVLVFGDLMLDRYLHGDVSRISPEAPVPVLEERRRFDAPGGAANVVNNLAALGARVLPLGLVGPDEAGARIRELLSHENVVTDGILVTEDRETTLKTRIIAGSHHVVRVDREQILPPAPETDKRLRHLLANLVPTVDAVIIQDYNKGLVQPELVEWLVQLCREQQVLTAVDPKREHFFAYHGVDLFKPNLKEARQALQAELPATATLEEIGRTLRERLQCRHLVITRGAEGMMTFDQEVIHRIPTEVQDVIDVSGAGDTVIAALVLGLLSGSTLVEAARFANTCAGLVCQELGAVPVRLEKLRECWHE
ncbi:D-glycero-beta-D-manno-heptose-7-phosphate kinase [bacterium]|nr:D-glycero-beta-D-manno-heptose-7-phosphate kinase [bacterium]